MAKTLIIVTKQSVSYLRSQLDTGDCGCIKRALQYICNMYRSGYRIQKADLIGLEQSIVGILFTRKNNDKVRNWALNALALCGTPEISMECVYNIFTEFCNHPQTAAAAVAALYRMQPDPARLKDALTIFDPQLRVLAALQHVPYTKLDLEGLPIDVENASPDILKLGLIVVGLDRAPANLFHSRHTNGEIIRALGSHDDPIVVQYTVWAVAQSDRLSIDDLGITMSSVGSLPANIRTWMYRAAAMSPAIVVKNQDYIAEGAGDPEAEVRLGLAIGLRDVYYDGLEALVLEWLCSESDMEVSYSLLDHIVKHATKCPNYEEIAIEHYEKEGRGSILRQRMEAYAAKTKLYGRFRQISYDGTDDLFRNGFNMTNNIFNGAINAGAVAIGGNASNSGTGNAHYTQQTIEAIQTELSKAINQIHNSEIDSELLHSSVEQIKAAQRDPNPEKISNAMDALGKVEAVLTKLAGITTSATSIGTIMASLGKMAGLI